MKSIIYLNQYYPKPTAGNPSGFSWELQSVLQALAELQQQIRRQTSNTKCTVDGIHHERQNHLRMKSFIDYRFFWSSLLSSNGYEPLASAGCKSRKTRRRKNLLENTNSQCRTAFHCGWRCLSIFHPRPATNYCLSTSIELHPGVAASVFPLATLWPSRGSPSRSPCYAARRRRFLDRAGWKQTAADTLQERPFVGQILAQRSKTRRGVSASPFRRPIRDIGTSFSQANAKGTCRG